MFYELDRDPMNRYICPWQKVWNKAHRLTWKTWPVNHLRLFSIKNHEIYYEKGSFDAQKYVEDIKTAKDKISNLSKIETWRVGLEMYDNYIPQIINTQHTSPWIRNKFEIAMLIKNNQEIVEGEEYKLFEGLRVESDWRMFIPLPTEFDNELTTKAQKSNYLLTKYTKEPLRIEQIEKINRYNKSHTTNFFFRPKTIKEIVNIITPEISHMGLKQKNELYSNMEQRLYGFLY